MSATGQARRSDHGWPLPVYPEERTCLTDRIGPVVPEPDSCTAANSILLDHLVGAREQCRGHFQPSAIAVIRLTTSSNLIGCSTGRSPGFVPRRILST